MLFFQYFTNGVLFKPVNLTNIILQNSYIIVMALGMLLVNVAGHIDLSVGSVSGFFGALAAMLMIRLEVSTRTGLSRQPAGGWRHLPCGGCRDRGGAGLHHRLSSGTGVHRDAGRGMLIFKGLSLAILSGKSVGPFPAEFQLLSAGFIPDVIGR